MPCVGHAFLLLLFCIRGPPKLPPSHAPFFAVLQVQPGIRMAMGPSPPGGVSRPHVDIEGLADFFAFLQCSLRMEAQECLGLELSLEDPPRRPDVASLRGLVGAGFGQA